MPALEACAHCGSAIITRGDTIAFGLATGGVICPGCRPGQPHVATLSGKTLDAIRALASPGAAWRELGADVATLGPVRSTVGAIISHLLGRRPRLLPYLGV
jgi:DNA repair protein RecO (recombination protein O)